MELIERLEAASGPDRELDERIGLAIGLKNTMRLGHECLGNDRIVPVMCPHYTASIDAALTLVPDGWGWDVSTRPDGTGGVVYLHSPDRSQWRDTGGFAATPALAICIAVLKARQS